MLIKILLKSHKMICPLPSISKLSCRNTEITKSDKPIVYIVKYSVSAND